MRGKPSTRNAADGDTRDSAAGARVLTSYVDGLGRERRPPREVVRALAAATAPAEESDGGGAGVVVVYAGVRGWRMDRRGVVERASEARLQLEDGGTLGASIDGVNGPGLRRVRLKEPIPAGVHELVMEHGERRTKVFVLARPVTLAGRAERGDRRLAVFLPLYSVRGSGAFGVGTYRDLRELCEWAEEAAGALVGTLPLFPAFLERPFEPSPYAPVTRLMWNELFIDPTEAPEWRSAAVRGVAGGRGVQADVQRVRSGAHVDYRRAWRVARRVLRAMAGVARSSARRWGEVVSSVSAETIRYGQFRAAVRATGTGWREWPAAWRAGRIDGGSVDEREVELHVYAQAIASEQVRSVRRGRLSRSPLYLDLPVGVHGDGFDTYARPDLFLEGFSAGAPPDDLNAHGQVWGFPPMHPLAGRADGYAHLRAVLRRVFTVARVLRIDHVMGLYRMFCVPRGGDGRAGAYVRYPEEELLAVVMIEAARAGAMVVGEDLGTVPPVVRGLMRKNGVLGMHVQQFAFGGAGRGVIEPAGAETLASLNTHDTPTFAGFWHADDIATRVSLGHVDAEQAAAARAGRAAARRSISRELRRRRLPARTARGVAMSLMRIQAAGPARIVLMNLEDAWGERRAQNVPGTVAEHPNWRRRASRSLDRIVRDRRLAAGLAALRRERVRGDREGRA